MSAPLFMRNAEGYARRLQAQRTNVAARREAVASAATKRTTRELTARLPEISEVPGLPRNRPNLAALRYYNVLANLHDDGGSKTERVDRFVLGSHSRPKPLVESVRERNAIGGTAADKKTANTVKRERFKANARPFVNVAGCDRWLDRQLRRPRPGTALRPPCRPDDGVACVWSSKPAGSGRRMTAGRSGSAKQRRGIRPGVL